jgi:hypothetical protein
MKKRQERRNKCHKPSSRVFSLTVDKAAFVDRIVVGVGSALKENFDTELLDPISTGIFRPGSLHSRRVSGRCPTTENPVTVVYGRTRKFKNLPEALFGVRSERVPATGAQVKWLLQRITRKSPAHYVSSLELTFDIRDVSPAYIARHLIKRARGEVRTVSDGKRDTLYIASPRSAWEVRVYEKRQDVLRIEFVLRRTFLARHGINSLEDVIALRRLPIWNLFSIRRFSETCAWKVTKNWDNDVARELVVTWGQYRYQFDGLSRLLQEHRVDPRLVLRRAEVQRRLEQMQRRFIW